MSAAAVQGDVGAQGGMAPLSISNSAAPLNRGIVPDFAVLHDPAGFAPCAGPALVPVLVARRASVAVRQREADQARAGTDVGAPHGVVAAGALADDQRAGRTVEADDV